MGLFRNGRADSWQTRGPEGCFQGKTWSEPLDNPRASCSSEFRRYYAGQALSYLGDGLRTLVIPLLVFHLTGSAASLGLTFAFELLPFALFSLLGGSLGDRTMRTLTYSATAMNAVAIFGFVAMIPFLKHEFGAGDQTVGLAFGCFSLGSVAGSLLAGMVPGSILGGVIADQWGTRAVMGISGLAFLLLALNLMGSRALLSERR